MKVIVALSGLLLLSACATATSEQAATGAAPSGQTAQAGGGGADNADDGKPKMRCVTERVTGSRFGRRICHTDTEWERMRDASQEGMREIQRMPVDGPEKAG